ncbi:hypothetical protein, partial [Plasmodium yoelii yoelii]
MSTLFYKLIQIINSLLIVKHSVLVLWVK